MKNIASDFGEGNRLKGVLCWPPGHRRTKVALVLVSAGFTAKSGPHRVYAELARSLADLGIATLRFDLGGIGTSQTLNPDRALSERTRHDIEDAVNYLQEQHGIEDLVVGGLCSGAEDAFRYAENDVRVKGVLLIDPHAYKTRMWPIMNVFSRRFLNRAIYKGLRVFRIVKVVHSENSASNTEGLESNLIDYRYMPLKESARILRTLLGRRVHVHYVYTGGRIDEFNHKRQILSMFGSMQFGNHLTLDHIPHIEHTQVFEEDRNELIAAISKRFAAAYR